MIRTTSSPASESLDLALDRVAAGERVVLQRDGKDAAALIPIEEFAFLERAIRAEEDRIDLRAAEQAIAEGTEVISYDQIRRELGLE
jgi:antitoxin (DNA-binding transcriptional repressor) of toxin-antitoxin stability system